MRARGREGRRGREGVCARRTSTRAGLGAGRTAAAAMAGLLAGLLACSPAPSALEPGGVGVETEIARESEPAPDHFSGARAAAHLEVLDGLGDRFPGSKADRTARAYLERELRASGASVRIASEGDRRHLLAEIAGDSPDVLMLVAPYPVLGRDEWVGDAGSAILLELARVLALERPPYTVHLALAETRAAPAVLPAGSILDGMEREPAIASRPGARRAEARAWVVEAGESLARALALEGATETLRGVLVFDASARPGLRLVRDLRSHPIYRQMIWESAATLGLADTFPPEGGWASPPSLHLGLEARSMGRVLALVDEARARPELALDLVAHGRDRNALDALGRTAAEGLGRLMHGLARIDAFAPRAAPPATRGQHSPELPENLPSS